jgi:hypothetical protein
MLKEPQNTPPRRECQLRGVDVCVGISSFPSLTQKRQAQKPSYEHCFENPEYYFTSRGPII